MRDLNSLILNPPATWTPTDAEAISPNGAFIAGIGWSDTSTTPPSGAEHAYVLNAGTLSEIPSLGGNTYPEAANSTGVIAGFYDDASGHVSAFVYSQALGTVDIGNLGPVLAGSGTRYTEAFGENDLGNVVGADFWNSGQEAAFLWTESSGMVEILPPAGVTFDGAYSISDTGIIAANGYYDNGAQRDTARLY